MQRVVAGCGGRLNAEEARARRAASDFLFGGFAHGLHLDLQAQSDARERVIAVQHHMFGVELGDGVERVLGHVGREAIGQGMAVKGHSLLDILGECLTRLQKDELVDIVAKGFLGFEVQRNFVADLVTLQSFLDALEQIVTAHEEFDGFVQDVQLVAKRILQDPGQCDNTLLSDFHRRIVAVHSDGRQRGLFHAMDAQKITPLLGGMSPAEFMRKHWHKKPLLVRQAIPGFEAPIPREELFELAAEEGVESRLIQQKKKGWSMDHGPFDPDSLPSTKTRDWTLLVQGVDLHNASARALLDQFRFVPEARLDDLMISYATNGGGVGPHFDSYDVFLLQAHGKRRWRIGRQRDMTLVEGMPVKILANFEPEEEYVLEPGDMLYLPPRWAHDGIAEGECMTYSIGFRSPQRDELARETLLRIADALGDSDGSPIYRDPKQEAVEAPGQVPAELQAFAREGVMRALAQSGIVERALGEALTEPKGNVWFDPPQEELDLQVTGVELDRRTRMMYDDAHIYINGESYRASGRDAKLMRKLADQRGLSAKQLAGASEAAISLLENWFDDGWVREASVI